jgi:hypothetical protein
MSMTEGQQIGFKELADVPNIQSVTTYGPGGLIEGYRINGHIVSETGLYIANDPHQSEKAETIELEDVAGLLGELAIENIFGN